jgi:hypothetical protein
VPLLPLPLPLLPPVVGWLTTVASPEPSWLLPDEPSPEDVLRSPPPEPDVCEPEPWVRDCSGVESGTSRLVTTAGSVGVAE